MDATRVLDLKLHKKCQKNISDHLSINYKPFNSYEGPLKGIRRSVKCSSRRKLVENEPRRWLRR
jgi:hypothetical protein